jgi:hypothetical protein
MPVSFLRIASHGKKKKQTANIDILRNLTKKTRKALKNKKARLNIFCVWGGAGIIFCF